MGDSFSGIFFITQTFFCQGILEIEMVSYRHTTTVRIIFLKMIQHCGRKLCRRENQLIFLYEALVRNCCECCFRSGRNSSNSALNAS